MTQDQAIKLALEGHNIFLTGCAGTGKTYTLNNIIRKLKIEGKRVAKTASTGIAATHINGSTIHSWAGIGIKEALTDEHLFKLRNNKFSRERIENADVLVIDEITMLHDYRFDMIERVCSFIRNPTLLFGGLQVIAIGDFCQLPPVNKSGEKNYCFNSHTWQHLDFKVCYLTKIYRQENDTEFIDILNGIRNGNVRNEHIQRLHSLSENHKHIKDAINLYCKNANVDVENSVELSKLPGEQKFFKMQWQGLEWKAKNMMKTVTANEFLILKNNAKGMLLINDYPGHRFVNGTLCHVIDVKGMDDGDEIRVEALKTGERFYINPWKWDEEEDGEVVASVIQYPVKLAYAITIHKSQGSTFDYVNLDLSDVFTENMGYVALSRATTLDGIFLKGFNELTLKIDPAIIDKDQEFRDLSRGIEEEC